MLKDALRVVRNGAFAIPAVRDAYARRLVAAGYDDTKDSASYVQDVFSEHTTRLGECGFSWAGKDVLEIGPGGNLGVSARFLQEGARSATAIDIVPWVGHPHDDLYREMGAEQIVADIRYLAPHDIHTTGLPDESFDLIFSHAVLEHVADPGAVARQTARLLRPDGAVSHRIDLRDHRDFDRSFEFLRYSEPMWRLMTSHLPWRTNRWRAGEHITALEESGLRVVLNEPTRTAEPNVTPSRRFANRDDLHILGVFVVAVK